MANLIGRRLGSTATGPLHGSHHWLLERGLAVASLGLLTTGMLRPHSLLNLGLAVVLPLHCHLGFSAIVTDYVPGRKFPRLYPLAMGGLYLATAGTIYGLYRYNTEDVGVCEGLLAVRE